jgi:hypothetical protein
LEQHRYPDQAHQSKKSTTHHGQQLLVLGADKLMVYSLRRQQADKVAGEDKDDTDMEEIAGQSHSLVSEQLAGARLPGIGLSVKTDPAAEKTDQNGDVRINPE